MSKKLNKTHLNKLKKDMNETKRIELGDYHVDIDKVFRETKIQLLFAELSASKEYAQENDIDFDKISILDWIMFYALKHFTTLDSVIPNNDIEKQIEIFDVLVNSGYYKTILEQIDQNEIKKIFDKAEQINKYYNSSQEFLDKFGTELKNKDVFLGEK